MALVIADRVKETTTTTGTGTINLAGAASGFRSFVSGVGNSNTTFYTIEDANGAWEIGIGTITDASPDTLARTTVLATSNGDTTKITLSSGTHTVFGTYPAGKAVYLDASGNLSHTVDISSDTNLAGGTGITLTGDTLSTTDSEIVHDNLSGFVANEHIDWTTDQGSTNIHSGNYTDTNTMGSGFTVSATTDTNATTITEGDDLFFAAGTGIACETTADGTVTISCTVTDTDTTYTKASFDLDHLFTLVGAAADTSENLGTFTGSTIADNQTIKAAIQAVETAVETKGATAGSSSIVTVGTISSGTWQGTAIAQAYIANDAINGDKIADDAVNSEHYAAGSIDEEHLNATNSPTDNYLLSYDDASGGFTWVAAGSGGENNEYSFKTISVAGQDDVVADTTTDTLTFAAGSNVTITTTAASDTVTIAATDTNTQLSTEEVQDIAGPLVATGGTKTLITVTYDDTNGDMDFVVDNDLSNYDNSSSGFLTAHPNISAASSSDNSGRTYIQDITVDSNGHVTGIATATETVTDTNTQLSTEEVQDIAGPLVATGGTKTLISVTYDDENGNMDFVVDNDLSNYSNSSSGFLTAHPSISAASSSDNSGRTYIQDITLDSNGHVTGIATATETVTDTNTQLSTEEVQDIAGGMFTGNTETLITATYQDADGTIDLVVDNDLSNYDNSSSGFLTAHPNISAASSSDNSGRTYIQDITVDSNGHVTGIATATETVTDTNTTYTGGTNLTLAGTTFNVDDAFLKNNADDTTSGTVTMANLIVGDAGNIGSASDTDAIAIASDGEVTLSQRTTFSKAVKTPLKSNSDGATITFDLDEASTHTVTLGDNRTLAISNEDAGQKFIINLVQDGTGSRTVTWFSTIKWAGGSAPTLTTTANKADSFGFLCTGTDAYYGFVIGQNI